VVGGIGCLPGIAEVRLWGRNIGAVTLADGDDVAAFQYDPAFARSGIEISPLVMPLSDRVYTFPELARETFHGLPGLLAHYDFNLAARMLTSRHSWRCGVSTCRWTASSSSSAAGCST